MTIKDLEKKYIKEISTPINPEKDQDKSKDEKQPKSLDIKVDLGGKFDDKKKEKGTDNQPCSPSFIQKLYDKHLKEEISVGNQVLTRSLSTLAKGIILINSDLEENFTSEDIKNYIQSQVDKIMTEYVTENKKITINNCIIEADGVLFKSASQCYYLPPRYRERIKEIVSEDLIQSIKNASKSINDILLEEGFESFDSNIFLYHVIDSALENKSPFESKVSEDYQIASKQYPLSPEAREKMEQLSNSESLNSIKSSSESIIKELAKEGFEEPDVRSFLYNLVDEAISGTSKNYESVLEASYFVNVLPKQQEPILKNIKNKYKNIRASKGDSSDEIFLDFSKYEDRKKAMSDQTQLLSDIKAWKQEIK